MQADARAGIVEAVRRHAAAGRALTPVARGTKKAVRAAWTSERLEGPELERLCLEAGNVGLILGTRSGGLVDVDLDDEAARYAWPSFAPPTAMRHGRASSAESHWWYRVGEATRTERLADPAGAVLLELRGDGGQTVIPPSVSYSHGRVDVPKGGKSRRVEMTTRLRTTLRAVYEARFQRVAALDAEQQATFEAEQATRAAEALIFPDTNGGHLEDHNVRNRVWLPLLTAAKLRRRRLHDLRHSYATLHLQGGTDPV